MAAAVVSPLQLHPGPAPDFPDQWRWRGRRGTIRRLRRFQNFGSDFPWRNPARQVWQGRVDRLVIVRRGKDTFARESFQENLRSPVVKGKMSQRVSDRPTIRQFALQVIIAESRHEPPQALELLPIPGNMIRWRVQCRLPYRRFTTCFRYG